MLIQQQRYLQCSLKTALTLSEFTEVKWQPSSHYAVDFSVTSISTFQDYIAISDAFEVRLLLQIIPLLFFECKSPSC